MEDKAANMVKKQELRQSTKAGQSHDEIKLSEVSEWMRSISIRWWKYLNMCK